MRVDEEGASKAKSLKTLREVEAQMNELAEDLDAEKGARVKAEKSKRELNEELEALKNELLDSLDSTAAQQELRTAREKELAGLKKALEDDTSNHENTVTEMRHKHSSEVMFIIYKIQILWEGHKNLKNISHFVLTLLSNLKRKWKILFKFVALSRYLNFEIIQPNVFFISWGTLILNPMFFCLGHISKWVIGQSEEVKIWFREVQEYPGRWNGWYVCWTKGCHGLQTRKWKAT